MIKLILNLFRHNYDKLGPMKVISRRVRRFQFLLSLKEYIEKFLEYLRLFSFFITWNLQNYLFIYLFVC
jgi:hypothetical protein